MTLLNRNALLLCLHGNRVQLQFLIWKIQFKSPSPFTLVSKCSPKVLTFCLPPSATAKHLKSLCRLPVMLQVHLCPTPPYYFFPTPLLTPYHKLNSSLSPFCLLLPLAAVFLLLFCSPFLEHFVKPLPPFLQVLPSTSFPFSPLSQIILEQFWPCDFSATA